MRSLGHITLALLFFVYLSLSSFAQSEITTSNAGPGQQANDALATSQAIGRPESVVPDGAGGFYVSSLSQERVYRVTADGRLRLVAGYGVAGFSGDGGPATAAELNYPSGVAVDAAGNLFIADNFNHRVRKVTPGGVISTVAGNGTGGFSGDGGPATSAQLFQPWCLAVDTSGNLFIADFGNNRIRKVTPGEVITTVAGNGTGGFSGDGGPTASAELYNPLGLAVDTSGNLFIADSRNSRVREVTPNGVIFTVAGNGFGASELAYPRDVAVDASGNLFVSDNYNTCILKVTPRGVISTVAGGGTDGLGDCGPATSAHLIPGGVAVDTAGNLFIADSGNYRVRKVTPGGVISTVAGNGNEGFSGDVGPTPPLAKAQSASPITTETVLLPDNRVQLTIQNNSSSPVTAWMITTDIHSIEHPSGPEHATGIAYYDTVTDTYNPYSFRSPWHPISPGEAQSFLFRSPGTPLPEVRPVAAVFSNGASFGDPQEVQRIIERRRYYLQLIDEVLGVLTEASSRKTSRAKLIERLRAFQEEHIATAPDAEHHIWARNVVAIVLAPLTSQSQARGEGIGDSTEASVDPVVIRLIDELSQRHDDLISSLPHLKGK